MNPFVKKLWVDELNNPELKQGRGCLRNENDELCCLGVLCEIAVRHGIIKAPKLLYGEYETAFIVPPDEDLYVYGNEQQGFTLPSEVMKWAELDSPDPEIGHSYGSEATTLAGINDEGEPFYLIARIVDENF